MTQDLRQVAEALERAGRGYHMHDDHPGILENCTAGGCTQINAALALPSVRAALAPPSYTDRCMTMSKDAAWLAGELDARAALSGAGPQAEHPARQAVIALRAKHIHERDYDDCGVCKLFMDALAALPARSSPAPPVGSPEDAR